MNMSAPRDGFPKFCPDASRLRLRETANGTMMAVTIRIIPTKTQITLGTYSYSSENQIEEPAKVVQR